MPLIVTAAIVRKGDRILITRRLKGSRHAGMWEFPGGKLEADESPEQALKRELLEELALPVEVGNIFEVVYHRYDFSPVLILAYDCLPLAETIQNLEVAEHRWVLPADLKRFDILPADEPIVSKLL